MQWTITRKLFLSLLIISLAILVMSAFFGRLSFQSGFNAYLEAREAPIIERLAADLAVEYQNSEGWDDLRTNDRLWRRHVMRAVPGRPFGDRRLPGRQQGRPEGGRSPPPPNSPRRLGDRIGLFDLDGQIIAGRPIGDPAEPSNNQDYLEARVVVAGNDVAELRLLQTHTPSSELDIAFDEEQKRSLLWIGLTLLLLSGLASWIIARQFTRPIRHVAEATATTSWGRWLRM